MFARKTHRVFDAVTSQWIFGADVQVTALAARRNRSDRHCLDDGERVALHEHTVLEGSRLRFVRIAYQVVWADRRARNRIPLAPGEERSPSTT